MPVTVNTRAFQIEDGQASDYPVADAWFRGLSDSRYSFVAITEVTVGGKVAWHRYRSGRTVMGSSGETKVLNAWDADGKVLLQEKWVYIDRTECAAPVELMSFAPALTLVAPAPATGGRKTAGAEGAKALIMDYMKAEFAGGRLSGAEYAKYPVLGDFADPERREIGEPAYDSASVISRWDIRSVSVDGDKGQVLVSISKTCDIAWPAVKEAAGEETLVFDVRWTDGIWRVEAPPGHPHTSLRAAREAWGSDEAMAARIDAGCSD